MSETTATNPMVPADAADIPDGVYPGIWGGYVVMFDAQGKTYMADTSEGIRTPKADCLVTVAGESITVKTVESRP